MNTFDNLTKYKIFLSVAENKSISKAAVQLYISQLAVSMAIRRMEENLNTTLFIRKSKGVEFTEKGRLLYDIAKKALNMLSDIEKSLRLPSSTGYLRLASSNVSRKHINSYYAKNNIMPLHILEVNEMDMLIEFAKMSIGVSCVVKQFVKDELKNGSLVEIILSSPIPPHEIGFLYNDIQPFNENILRFINVFEG